MHCFRREIYVRNGEKQICGKQGVLLKGDLDASVRKTENCQFADLRVAFDVKRIMFRRLDGQSDWRAAWFGSWLVMPRLRPK
jgi:hypothetical protein